MRMSVAVVIGLVTLWVTSPLHAQSSKAEIDWRTGISAQVSDRKDFPAGYLGDGGTAKLGFTIERSGSLKSVDITNSSGSKVLDDKALEIFHRALPFQPAPDEAKGESFTFSLDIVFGGQRPPVDVELVIAADVSYSMGKDDLVLRRGAYAQAIASSEFAQALKAGRLGKIALTYFEWSATSYQDIIVSRREIDGPEAAAAFAAEIADARTVPRTRTSISNAINFATKLFRNNHSDGARRVLDISGDGPNNDGEPVLDARDTALSKEITINAVTIMYPGATRPQADTDRLDNYFTDCVIGGQNAFLLPVRDAADLKVTIRTALVSEITGRVPEHAQTSTAEREQRVSCRKGEEVVEKVWATPGSKKTFEPRYAVREDVPPRPTAFATSECFERLKSGVKNPVDLSATIGPDGMIVGDPRPASPKKRDEVRADIDAATRILRQCQPYLVDLAGGERREVSHTFRFGDAQLARDSIAEAIKANFKKCWKPARTGPTVLISLDYKPDGTYQGKPMLINPLNTPEYSRAAAAVTTQINKCPPVKFPQGVLPQPSIRWEFQSDESARTSRSRT